MTVKVLTIQQDASGIAVKGGEKTENRTKWESYSDFSKDDLIIRLVAAEAKHSEFVATIESLAKDGARWAIPDLGERPPEEWLGKIIAYAKAHAEDFSYMDLAEYGVDLETAERLWRRGRGCRALRGKSWRPRHPCTRTVSPRKTGSDRRAPTMHSTPRLTAM